MGIRRSDRDNLSNLMSEYGIAAIIDGVLDIFDADMAETDEDDQTIGVLDRALRKIVKLQSIKAASTPPARRGRSLQVNPVEPEDEDDEDEFDDEEGDEEFEDEDEDEVD